jgi:hypothetical protein
MVEAEIGRGGQGGKDFIHDSLLCHDLHGSLDLSAELVKEKRSSLGALLTSGILTGLKETEGYEESSQLEFGFALYRRKGSAKEGSP